MDGHLPDPRGWARVVAALGVVRAAIYLLAGIALLAPLVLIQRVGAGVAIAYLAAALIAWARVGRALRSSRR